MVDSYCGDNICGFGENSLNCPSDCEAEKESNTGFFILLTLVILVAIALVVFFIFKKMKGSRSSSISITPPSATTAPAVPSFPRQRMSSSVALRPTRRSDVRKDTNQKQKFL